MSILPLTSHTPAPPNPLLDLLLLPGAEQNLTAKPSLKNGRPTVLLEHEGSRLEVQYQVESNEISFNGTLGPVPVKGKGTYDPATGDLKMGGTVAGIPFRLEMAQTGEIHLQAGPISMQTNLEELKSHGNKLQQWVGGLLTKARDVLISQWKDRGQQVEAIDHSIDRSKLYGTELDTAFVRTA